MTERMTERMTPRPALALIALVACLTALQPRSAAAQGVALSGTMGTRALLVIDGQAQMLAPGQEHKGVKLVEVQGDQAQVVRDGVKLLLRVGAAPVSVGGRAVPSGSEVVMSASSGGHFIADGSINGRVARFMVDTGATTVAIGQADAERMGLEWSKGERGMAHTANGSVPVYRVKLASLRVGDVEVNNIDATVMPANMPFVLLGNSFLSRFQMRRDNDIMRLELRR